MRSTSSVVMVTNSARYLASTTHTVSILSHNLASTTTHVATNAAAASAEPGAPAALRGFTAVHRVSNVSHTLTQSRKASGDGC